MVMSLPSPADGLMQHGPCYAVLEERGCTLCCSITIKAAHHSEGVTSAQSPQSHLLSKPLRYIQIILVCIKSHNLCGDCNTVWAMTFLLTFH